MTVIQLIIFLMFLHFLGDFVFQSDEMAKKKGASLGWLSIHVITYSLVLWIGTVLFGNFWGAFIFTVINGLAHFVVDFFTSKFNALMWKKGLVHWFFVGIGFDQFLHLSIICLTCKLLV